MVIGKQILTYRVMWPVWRKETLDCMYADYRTNFLVLVYQNFSEQVCINVWSWLVPDGTLY